MVSLMIRKPHLLILLVASFVILVSAFVIDQACRWSDPLEGNLNGLVHSILLGPGWFIIILPLSLVIYGVFRWRRWERNRSLAVLAPSLACFLATLAGLIVDPPTAPHRFYRFTEVNLPASVRDIRTHFTGGGLADYGDTYYFRCSAEDTDRLIAALGLRLADEYDQDWFATRPIPSWPDPSAWTGRLVYRGGRNHWFYYLVTDASREQVYLFIGCI